ncbi:gibberellin 2beta-dioxygenase [Ranunculus cassubicifolius]
MVLSSSPSPIRIEKIPSFHDAPIIDISCKKRSLVSELVVKASEKYGFFTVINHGIPNDVVDGMEREGFNFFAKPTLEKTRLAGGPSPLGYGMKNIGFNGDMGEVEYLLLPSNPHSITQFISKDPTSFNSCIVNDYTQGVRNLACEILELMAEGLHVNNKYALSNLIRDIDSDSLIRLNHYPPYKDTSSLDTRIGFGQHSDPQILTILRSNHVGGLQILLEDGLWVPVTPHPMAFCVLVGDTLQVLTNGRFKSVIHRALADPNKARMSVMYFGAPPLHAVIAPIADMVSSPNLSLYRPFTWGEYKKTTYSLRLGECRLDLFNVQIEDDGTVPHYMEETTHTIHQLNPHKV